MDGAGSSRMFQVRGPQMIASHYHPPTATIKTHLKDLSIIDGFARSLNMPLPLYATASQHYYAALGRGYGDANSASVCAVAETLAGIPDRGADAGGDAGTVSE